MLNIMGWKIIGDVPNINKAVLVVAPHTSNWDFIIAMAALLAKQVKLSYFDRSAAGDTVEQIKNEYQRSAALWVAITPEGTRAKVERWKTGFLRIAIQAEVPIVIIAWDYPTKCLHVDKVWWPESDQDSEAEAIKEYIFSRYTGKHPERQ